MPPIGAVIVTDQLLLGGIDQPAVDVPYRIPAFVAWGAGAAAAMLVHWGVPAPGEAITGMLVGAAVYAIIGRTHVVGVAALEERESA